MKSNPVGWFEIYVQHIGRAKKFYESVFQLKLKKLNTPGMEMWAFPMEMDRWGAGGAWSKWMAFPPAGTAPWFISVLKIAQLRKAESQNLEEVFSERKCLLVSTALSPWFLTPKKICLAYIH
jgi:predicted enzyme related to lactoylglutathione lyase